MNSKTGQELQVRNLEAAARLTELSTDSTLKVMALLVGLAQKLFEETVRNAEAQAAAVDAAEMVRLRAEYARTTMRLMLEGAQLIAAVGNDVRLQFSRLLTEQLASGSHELLDVFQSFFKVLPAPEAEAVDAMERAVSRGHSAFEEIELVTAPGARPSGESRQQRTSAKHRRVPSAGLPVVPPRGPSVESRVC